MTCPRSLAALRVGRGARATCHLAVPLQFTKDLQYPGRYLGIYCRVWDLMRGIQSTCKGGPPADWRLRGCSTREDDQNKGMTMVSFTNCFFFFLVFFLLRSGRCHSCPFVSCVCGGLLHLRS